MDTVLGVLQITDICTDIVQGFPSEYGARCAVNGVGEELNGRIDQILLMSLSLLLANTSLRPEPAVSFK